MPLIFSQMHHKCDVNANFRFFLKKNSIHVKMSDNRQTPRELFAWVLENVN